MAVQSSLRLRPAHLVQRGELGPSSDQLPQPQRGRSRRGGNDHRTEDAGVVEEQCGHAEAADGDDAVVVGLDLVGRRRIGDGLVHEIGVEADLLQDPRAPSGLWGLRPSTCNHRPAAS